MFTMQAGKLIGEDWLVFVDPEVLATPGDVVLASICGPDPVVGVLVKHGSRTYVKPANDRYPLEEVGSCRADWYLGKAVFTGCAI
jgi:SOS-response transcriptional repressor LexA